MRALYDRARVAAARGEKPWEPLREWATKTRTTIDGEAALALELLLGYAEYELTDLVRARDTAAVVISATAGSDDLRRDARRLGALLLLRRARGPRSARPRQQGESRSRTSAAARARALLRPGETGNSEHPLRLRGSRADLAILDPLFEGRTRRGPRARRGGRSRRRRSRAGWRATGGGIPRSSSSRRTARSEGPVGARGAVEEVAGSQRGRRPAGGRRLRATTTWPLCRELWHDLAARRHTRFDEDTWDEAKRIGPEATAALLLASAFDREPPERAGDVTSVHGQLAAAWRALRVKQDRAAWDAATKPLAKPGTDECLEVTDAIYDLGLFGEDVREAMEGSRRTARAGETMALAIQFATRRPAAASSGTATRRSGSRVEALALPPQQGARFAHPALGDAHARAEKALDYLEP
jgi:hypothetical protein